MKTTLISGICFILGTLFGSLLIYRSVTRGVMHASIETVAKRAVNDVATAYEAQLNKSGVFEKVRTKIEECAKENLALKKRVWRLENPRPACPGGARSCEIYP